MRKPTAKECRARLLAELRRSINELKDLRKAGHRHSPHSWDREDYEQAKGAVRALMHACSQCAAINDKQFQSINNFVHSVPLTFLIAQRQAKAGAA